jgi:hypothetical protein
MSTVPFAISPDAAAWIVKTVQWSEKQRRRTGLLPALLFCFGERHWDKDGRLLEWCRHPFFDIGWYPSEYVAAEGFVEMEIRSVKIFAPPDTLQRLEGRQLVLETVEVGYPHPADKTAQLLMADPKDLSEGASAPDLHQHSGCAGG